MGYRLASRKWEYSLTAVALSGTSSERKSQGTGLLVSTSGSHRQPERSGSVTVTGRWLVLKATQISPFNESLCSYIKQQQKKSVSGVIIGQLVLGKVYRIELYTMVNATNLLVSDQSGVLGWWPCHWSRSAVGNSSRPRDSHSLQFVVQQNTRLMAHVGWMLSSRVGEGLSGWCTHQRNLVMSRQKRQKSDEDSSFLSQRKQLNCGT